MSLAAPAESIRGVLEALRDADGSVEGCALLTLGGGVIAAAWPAGLGVDGLAATTAAVFGAGEGMVRELARGRLERVMLHGAGGWVVVEDAGDGTLLAVVARADARLGLVLVAIRRAADRLATLLLPPFPAFS